MNYLLQCKTRAETGAYPLLGVNGATDRAELALLDPALNVATLRAKISLHVAEPPNMTQRLHLVFGGELVTPQKNVFRDVSQIHIVGMFPDYASAFAAWKAEAQRTVDNAHMRYFIAHIHRLRDEEISGSSTEELGA